MLSSGVLNSWPIPAMRAPMASILREPGYDGNVPLDPPGWTSAAGIAADPHDGSRIRVKASFARSRSGCGFRSTASAPTRRASSSTSGET